MVSCKFSLKPIHWKSCCPWWPDRWSDHSAAAPTPIAQQCQRKSLCATPPGPSYASYRRGARPTAHLFSPWFFRGRAMDGQPVIYSGSRNMEAMLREHGWDFWVFLENIWKYDWVISDNYHENYPNNPVNYHVISGLVSKPGIPGMARFSPMFSFTMIQAVQKAQLGSWRIHQLAQRKFNGEMFHSYVKQRVTGNSRETYFFRKVYGFPSTFAFNSVSTNRTPWPLPRPLLRAAMDLWNARWFQHLLGTKNWSSHVSSHIPWRIHVMMVEKC